METPPPDLSQDDKSVLFDGLDLSLNTLILESLLHGLYTGIIAVTLWAIFTSTKRSHRTFLRIIIIALYVLRTVSFTMDWVFESRAFIEYGDNYYSVSTALDNGPWWSAYYILDGIAGGSSTLLVDVTIIWRCWVLWDRQWRIVLLPIICAIAGTFMKTMQLLSGFFDSTDDISKTGGFAQNINWSLIYALLILATNLICTLSIVYRIICFAHRLLLSRSIISALIESSAIYTLALVVYLALVGRNMTAAFYADVVAAYIRAIAPTLLVLRVAAMSTASEETTSSRDLSDIHFKRRDENSGDDTGDSNSPGSHCRAGTAEIV
ncbi:uncharacterized protein ARMOST_18971 [Armillaria ostoyae]|uniref:Uncharacterized protein n=1 Tax=Armillaria ostoyae TaxID=47428 RepID=A0A284S380_ARMOS|nr:uncharacterized protein ARMOST_18971 [Armillaria ostoyae]